MIRPLPAILGIVLAGWLLGAEAASAQASVGAEPALSVIRSDETMARPAATLTLTLAADGATVERELKGVRMKTSLAACPGLAALLPGLADAPGKPAALTGPLPDFPNDAGANRYALSYRATIAGAPVRVSMDGLWQTGAWDWSEHAFAALALCLDGQPEPVAHFEGQADRATLALGASLTLDPGGGGPAISLPQNRASLGYAADVRVMRQDGPAAPIDLCPAARDGLAELAGFVIVPDLAAAPTRTQSSAAKASRPSVNYITDSHGWRGAMTIESLDGEGPFETWVKSVHAAALACLKRAG